MKLCRIVRTDNVIEISVFDVFISSVLVQNYVKIVVGEHVPRKDIHQNGVRYIDQRLVTDHRKTQYDLCTIANTCTSDAKNRCSKTSFTAGYRPLQLRSLAISFFANTKPRITDCGPTKLEVD